MKSFTYIITDEIGIHARPAGLLAKAAKDYESVITLEGNGRSSDVRKLMGVMSLGVKQGTEVTIKVEGPDEEKACADMEAFFKENL